MPTKPALIVVLACALCACSFTASSPFAEYDELPSGRRDAAGLWDLGDKNCKGSIQTVDGKPYWVVDCWLKAGFGHCTHGLPLVKTASDAYRSTDGSVTFQIKPDGRLDESKYGKVANSYAPLTGSICGGS